MQNAGTRRNDTNRRRSVPAARNSGFGLKRIVLVSTLGLFAALGVYLFFSTGSAGLVREWGRERLVQLAGNMGYRVQNIYVEGRAYTEAELLRGVLNMKKGDPLFSFDPETARDLLLKISWIKDVNVQRQMPDTLFINITERTPIALWQNDGRVRVVDQEGVVLSADIAPFSNLPLVVGLGANKKIASLLLQLKAEPELMTRIEAASWVGERRWDLKMKDGLVIRLPEDDVGLALKKLADSQRQDKMLDKDVALIDLREPDRFVIRTKPGAVQEYKASFKTGGGDI